MKTKCRWAAVAGLVLAGSAGAQTGDPQQRGTWADSTHVTGVAEKVMPAAPPAPETGSRPPSVQDLLNRMDGSDLYFRQAWDNRSGWQELPAVWRVLVRASGAAVQTHSASRKAWETQCTLTPVNTRCETRLGRGPYLVTDIGSSTITVSGAYCLAGSVVGGTAWATYGWDHHQAGTGAFSNRNRQLQAAGNGYSGFFFQNGSYSASCASLGEGY